MFAAFCATCAVVCHAGARAITRRERQLATTKSDLLLLGADVERLGAEIGRVRSMHLRLAGQFTKQFGAYAPEPALSDHPDYCHEHGGHLRGSPACDLALSKREIACDNWALACANGPTSAAAQCTCAYCERKREERARLRRDNVPRDARALAEFSERNQ
jgi:hypothetical protein